MGRLPEGLNYWSFGFRHVSQRERQGRLPRQVPGGKGRKEWWRLQVLLPPERHLHLLAAEELQGLCGLRRVLHRPEGLSQASRGSEEEQEGPQVLDGWQEPQDVAVCSLLQHVRRVQASQVKVKKRQCSPQARGDGGVGADENAAQAERARAQDFISQGKGAKQVFN